MIFTADKSTLKIIITVFKVIYLGLFVSFMAEYLLSLNGALDNEKALGLGIQLSFLSYPAAFVAAMVSSITTWLPQIFQILISIVVAMLFTYWLWFVLIPNFIENKLREDVPQRQEISVFLSIALFAFCLLIQFIYVSN